MLDSALNLYTKGYDVKIIEQCIGEYKYKFIVDQETIENRAYEIEQLSKEGIIGLER